MSGAASPEFNQQTANATFTVTADATNTVLVAKGQINIDSAVATFQAAVATHGTDFATYSLTNIGTDASGTTVVAGANNFGSAGAAITAHVPVTLTTVDAANTLDDGEVLAFIWDEETTDVADATVHVQVRYTQQSAPTQGA